MAIARVTFCASIMFATCALAVPQRIEVSWRVQLGPQSHGFGIVSGGQQKVADWVEPSDAAGLGIGFDTHNPKTDDIFSADGNIYGRPQREVSIHWRGREIANRLCATEMKTDTAVPYVVSLAATVGGSLVTVQVGPTKVYDQFFIEGLQPEIGSWQIGGEFAGVAPKLRTSDSGKANDPVAPVTIPLLTKVLNDAGHHRAQAIVDFAAAPAHSARIIGHLKLDATPAGIDRWDRSAHIYLTDDQGRRFEIVRYMTPYRKAWEWSLDLTDLAPLFRGRRTMDLLCETYGEGWLVSFDLAFYPGKLRDEAVEVIPLWSGVPAVGLKSQPSSAFFVPREVTLPKSTTRATIRTVVTGHGQAPNAKNAAEFIPLWRTLTVNDHAFKNRLWNEDVYLNPCRPQGGTWKFDRAGWAPGSVVQPWTVDATPHLRRNAPNQIRYEIEPFENTTPDMGNLARHIFEGVLIRYERVR